jgi:lipopolysaccharide transport system permease protein
MNPLREIWQFRGLVRALTLSDLRGRYTGAILGPAWLILQPLAMVIVYTVIFSQVMKARMPGQAGEYAYSQFLCAGLMAWNFFTDILTRGKNVFVEHSNLIKKTSFPRLVLLLPVVALAIVNLLIMFVLTMGFFVAIGSAPGWAVITLIPMLVLLGLLSLGLALLAAVFQVFFRDIGQGIDIGLQFLFWSTPIIYAVGILPTNFAKALSWNPIFGPVSQIQHVFLTGEWPNWEVLGYPLLFAAVLWSVALLSYKRLYPSMLDEL